MGHVQLCRGIKPGNILYLVTYPLYSSAFTTTYASATSSFTTTHLTAVSDKTTIEIDIKGGFVDMKKSEVFEMTDYVCPTTML